MSKPQGETVPTSANLPNKARQRLFALAKSERLTVTMLVSSAVAAALETRRLADAPTLGKYDYLMPVAARLTVSTREALKRWAKQERCSVAALMGRIILHELERRGETLG